MKVRVKYADNNYRFDKNPNQVISICPELNKMLVSSNGKEGDFDRYQKGGLGNVTYEGPKSFYEDLKMDIRSVLPYHNECLDGTLKILRLPKSERIKKAQQEKNYVLPDLLNPEWIFKVPGDYQLEKDEYFVLPTQGTTKDANDGDKEKYKYILLEDTGIKGEITSLKEAYMELQKVPYRVFRQVNHKECEKYFIYTPQMAAMKEAYGGNGAYTSGQIISKFYDAYYADFCRAAVDAGRQLKSKYGFNPANVWLHDRPAFAYLFEMTRRSAEGDTFENGKKVHCTLHNPGRDYQGYMGDIESFLRIAFDEADFKKLQEHPQYFELKKILSIPSEKRSVADKKIIEAFFKPYFKSMIDDMGTTNQTMIPVAAAKINPESTSVGTVSKNYGMEMITLNDIAKGITNGLRSIKNNMINVTNGSLPASLNLNNTNSSFGKPDNGISSFHKREFTPFAPVRNENYEVLNYKESKLNILNNEIKEFNNKTKILSSKEKNNIEKYLKAQETIRCNIDKKENTEYITAEKFIEKFENFIKKQSAKKKEAIKTYIKSSKKIDKYNQEIKEYESRKKEYQTLKIKFYNAKKIKNNYDKLADELNLSNIDANEKFKITDIIDIARKSKIEDIKFEDFAQYLYDKETAVQKEARKDEKEKIAVTGEELLSKINADKNNTNTDCDGIIKAIREEKFNALFPKLSKEQLNEKYKDDTINAKDVKGVIANASKQYEDADKKFGEAMDIINLMENSIKEAKRKNKEWIVKLVSDQYREGKPKETKENLEKLFFNNAQIKDNKLEVLGYLKSSNDKKADRIYANWGRPDPQKGYPTFLLGFYKFLKMKEPPKDSKIKVTKEELEDMKKHAKLLFGSGGGLWNNQAEHSEYKLITKYINDIQKLENGKYAGNVCYINGFFPNRLIACSDYGLFTSRFEPCGITPLEAYAAGTPVASIRTGGAPDFVFDINENSINKATGILSKHPFMRNDVDLENENYMNISNEKEKILCGEREWNHETMDKEYAKVLDAKRIDAASDEVARMFFDSMALSMKDENAYDKLCENCLNQRIDWITNKKFNRNYKDDGKGGYEKDYSVNEADLKSASDVYAEDIYGVSGSKCKAEDRTFIRPRSINRLKKLTGEFPKHVDIAGIRRAYPDFNDNNHNYTRPTVSFRGFAATNNMKIISVNIKQNCGTKVFVG